MPWDTLITALFGAGGAGMVAGLLNIIRSRQTGKIEREETLISRLDKSNQEHKERADAAELKADIADEEASKQRRRAERALDIAYHLRRRLAQYEDVTQIQIEE
jgi:multidrug efflux pump subunit AcrA (membrane-fusion protein)